MKGLDIDLYQHMEILLLKFSEKQELNLQGLKPAKSYWYLLSREKWILNLLSCLQFSAASLL